MTAHRKLTLVALVIGAVALSVGTAAADANCNFLPHGVARANCYGAQSQIYRQLSNQYNGIAQQQYQTHQNVGRFIGSAPIFGRYAKPAWNAPRYIYNYGFGRP